MIQDKQPKNADLNLQGAPSSAQQSQEEHSCTPRAGAVCPRDCPSQYLFLSSYVELTAVAIGA